MALEKRLNSVEKNMHKSLMNHPELNLTKKWKRGHGYFLIGTKTTNPLNGESKITFRTSSDIKEFVDKIVDKIIPHDEKPPYKTIQHEKPTQTKKDEILTMILSSKTEIKKEINQLDGLIHAKTLIIELSTEAIEQAKSKANGLRIALEILQKNSK